MDITDRKPVTEMSPDELEDMYDDIESEQAHYDDLVEELEANKAIIRGTHRIVGNRDRGYWTEISLQYNRPDIGGKSIPMDMLRWGRENGLSLKAHYEMPEYGEWGATFVVDETIPEGI